MLTPWKESYDQPRQHIQKQRHYFANKGPSSQGYGFSVVMYGCESWTVKKAECQSIDAFELWCWRRLLRVPWTARRSNRSILKEISRGVHWKDWCWSWNSNILATLYEESTHWKRPRCWEGLGGRRRRGWPRMRWLDGITDLMDMNLCKFGSWWWTGRPGVLQFMGSQRVGHDWVTELNWILCPSYKLNINQTMNNLWSS